MKVRYKGNPLMPVSKDEADLILKSGKGKIRLDRVHRFEYIELLNAPPGFNSTKRVI